MFDFHEKRKIRTILYSKTAILVVGIIAIAIALSAFERFKVERTMAERREEKERELAREQARIQELKAEVGYFQDQRGIEEELRDRFDVIREGEQVVVIVDDDTKKQATSTESNNRGEFQEKTEKKGFFEMLKFW